MFIVYISYRDAFKLGFAWGPGSTRAFRWLLSGVVLWSQINNNRVATQRGTNNNQHSKAANKRALRLNSFIKSRVRVWTKYILYVQQHCLRKYEKHIQCIHKRLYKPWWLVYILVLVDMCIVNLYFAAQLHRLTAPTSHIIICANGFSPKQHYFMFNTL